MELKSFSQFLQEALITFGNRAYPKFGNIVVLQGGAGSGKGFVKSKLLGIEGWNFDVDELKNLAMSSTVFAAKVKTETGVDLHKIDLKNPDNVALIHTVLADLYKVDKKFKSTIFKSVATAAPDRKPNLIFDITGKSLGKFKEIAELAKNFGYDMKNVHVVWVLDDVKAAIVKNKERSRTVPEDILIQTHEGASLTAKKLLSMGEDIKQYMDGDYWVAFNKVNVDTSNVSSGRGGFYIKEANYFKLKAQGKAPISPDVLDKMIYDKIKSYVPNVDKW